MGRKAKPFNVRKKQSRTPPVATSNTQLSLLSEPEHTKMLQNLAKLPPYPYGRPLKFAQTKQIENAQKWWRWIGGRIDWLQKEQLGFCLPDPLNHPFFLDHDLAKRLLDTYSQYHFAQLQLCIVGWKFIKEAAALNRRDFPFLDARSLFSHICFQQSESDISGILEDSEGGLTQQRENLLKRNAFYRDRLSPDETSELLKIHQNSEQWANFIIYAIWEKKLSSERRSFSSPQMRDVWQTFLKTHQALTTFWCKKTHDDSHKVIIPAWRDGIAINPQSSRQIYQEY